MRFLDYLQVNWGISLGVLNLRGDLEESAVWLLREEKRRERMKEQTTKPQVLPCSKGV